MFFFDVAPEPRPHDGAADFAGSPVASLLPLLFVGVLWGAVIFFIARKRGDNPWLWAVVCGLPLIGGVMTVVYLLLTLHSILDRLNRLEGRPPS